MGQRGNGGSSMPASAVAAAMAAPERVHGRVETHQLMIARADPGATEQGAVRGDEHRIGLGAAPVEGQDRRLGVGAHAG